MAWRMPHARRTQGIWQSMNFSAVLGLVLLVAAIATVMWYYRSRS